MTLPNAEPLGFVSSVSPGPGGIETRPSRRNRDQRIGWANDSQTSCGMVLGGCGSFTLNVPILNERRVDVSNDGRRVAFSDDALVSNPRSSSA